MNGEVRADLVGYSRELESLIETAAKGVVALRVGRHRSVSGIVLPQGLVATTSHSVSRRERMPFLSPSGVEGEAEVVGRDDGLDLALLKSNAEVTGSLEPQEGSSLRAGALAAIVGFTFDAGPSASLGILGAVGGERQTWRGGSLDQFLRLDVNCYPSQSGAAVVNAQGRLIGMATPALSRHATVAIPAATIARAADELAKEGRIRHGYIGVGVQPVALQASVIEKLGLAQKRGLMLLSIEDGSAADKAGLQLGDVLLEFNGTVLVDAEDLQAAIRKTKVGNAVDVTFLRGGLSEKRGLVVSERVR